MNQEKHVEITNEKITTSLEDNIRHSAILEDLIKTQFLYNIISYRESLEKTVCRDVFNCKNLPIE